MGTTLLRDYGERRIVREIIPTYCPASGHDCGMVALNDSDLVLTTDPVPVPAAELIGKDSDPYWMGWLLAVINASDLAAAGASPLAFVGAIELEPTRPVDDLHRFLAGLRDSCANEGLPYVGGNLREGPRLSAVGTAIGKVESGTMLTRCGAREGDVLASVGSGGIFWRDALTLMRGGTIKDKKESPVFAPHSQLRAMNALARARLIHCAIDNSDGLLPSLSQLTSATSISVTVDLNELTVPGVDPSRLDPARLWLGWGDWNVLVAFAEQDFDRAARLSEENGTTIIRIGEFQEPGTEVVLRRGSQTMIAPRVESERFAPDSWFTSGIQGYADRLISVELPM